jgi:glucokinase
LSGAKTDLTVKEIFSLAQKGDGVANQVVEEIGKHLAYIAVSIKAIADPQLMVLGGGIGSNPILLPIVQKWANKLVPFEVEIEVTSLDAKAGVIGAAAFAAEKIRTRMMVETTERKNNEQVSN